MKKLVVLGGGESGVGSAILGQRKGFEVFLSDSSRLTAKYADMLTREGIHFEEGGHTMERILEADLVIKSPGIPDKVAVIKALREAGKEIISEIEFAGRYTSARTLCITGSNGKTTTTTLTHKILEDAGFNVGLGGNIGKSFALSVATEDKDWYVLELSSFQLDGMFDFRADISVLMNITPDHLDRYNYKFEDYAASKMRIARNQTSEQKFVFMADDKNISSRLDAHAAEVTRLPFSKDMVGEDGIIRLSLGDKELEINSNKLQIKGLHNMYNAMAASLAAMAAGVPAESILSSLYSFEGVEHRLEPAGVVDGVEYINDSKATNVDSVWYALGSMTRPTIWIAGGTDKGNDYEPLKELVYEKVKALVCMGLNNERLVESFRGVVPVYPTNSLDEAMKVCRSVAKEGYTVLLSPACASFDLFKNYEDRGRQFKEYVKKIQNNG
ncbi:MAG: UDP-N-acetylmuramoyl-L-alanine--D-glutamate ligase [Tidjanibacter sp.]|nr:UDP-N-acetylmuramoyl-L-alanine--D-glutamate ligase [Tidjanibacter sp.]